MIQSAVEAASLPRFETVDGVLAGSVDVDVSHGLVLEETGRKLWSEELHDTHMETAKIVLTAAGCVTNPVLEPEGYRNFFSLSDPHIDGLTFEYFQEHTTLEDTTMPSGHQGATDLRLEMYRLSLEEHERLQQVHDNLQAPGPFKPVIMGDGMPAGVGLTLWWATCGRNPDACWQSLARPPKTTIIFRNGYDASSASSTGILYVHSGKTIGRPDAVTDQRMIALSRIRSR